MKRSSIPRIAAFLAMASFTDAATLTVDVNGGADYTDIQAAIDAAVNGDTVLVKPGEYVITQSIDFKGKAIVVRGEAGAAATTIRMSEAPSDPKRASVVVFQNGETIASVLQGLTLTGGKGTKRSFLSQSGGGILCRDGSSPTLIDCAITQNSASGEDGGVWRRHRILLVGLRGRRHRRRNPGDSYLH